MALDVLQAAETINALEIFLDKRRPPEHMRHELDLAYKIEGQSVIIYSIRSEEILDEPIAKTTWVHTQKVWKIFWIRADLKWHSHEPRPKVKTIRQFLKVVDEDSYGCFWG